MSLDGSFKRGTVRDPLGMLFLAGRLSLESDARISPCDREIVPPHKFADSVFRVEERDGRVHYEHLEALARWHGREPEAIALRFGALLQLPETRGNALHTTVVLLNERECPALLPADFKIHAQGGEIVVWPRYVRVWEIDGDALVGLNRDTLLPWVAVARASEDALKTAAARIAARQDEDLGSMFVTLGSVRYNEEYLRNLLGRYGSMLTGEVLAETPVGEKIRDIWMERGVQKGVQLGIQQGVQQGVQLGVQQGVQLGVQQGVQLGVQQGIEREAVVALRAFLEHHYPALAQRAEADRLAGLRDPHELLMRVLAAPDEASVWAIIAEAVNG